MTYPSRIIGWPRFIHPGWKIMLDAGRFPFYAARFTADAPGLYTDTALTVPVTSYGDAVAGWRGAGLVGVQPTLTARPVYGRMPFSGITNILALQANVAPSENVGGTGWVCGNVGFPSVSGTLDGKPANRMELLVGTSPRNVRVAANGVTGWGSFAVDVSEMATKVAVIELSGAGRATFTWTGPQTIEITESTSDVQDSYYEVLGDYQAIIHARTVTPITGNFSLYVGTYGSYTSEGGEYFRVTRAMLSEGAVEQPYQKVTAAYDVTQSGVPDTPILYYDLGDDVLPAAMELPEVTGGTLVIAGEKGIWIEDSFNHAGGSWSLGPTTYTGGPTGLLPSLIGNRALGFAVFAGQLTPEQLQVEVAYWMGKGAPGVWEADVIDELDGAPFTVLGNNEFTLASGVATLTRAAGGNEVIVTFNGLLPESIWLFSGNVTDFAGRAAGVYRATNPLVQATADSDGNLGFVSQGTFSNNLIFRIRGAPPSGPVTQIWEGVSLRKLTLNTDPYP